MILPLSDFKQSISTQCHYIMVYDSGNIPKNQNDSFSN